MDLLDQTAFCFLKVQAFKGGAYSSQKETRKRDQTPGLILVLYPIPMLALI